MAKFIMTVRLPGSNVAEALRQAVGKYNLKKFIVINYGDTYHSIYKDDDYGRQGNNSKRRQKTFERMRQRSVAALRKGIDVIYEGYNPERRKRHSLLAQLPPCEKGAYVVWERIGQCRAKSSVNEVNKVLMSFNPPYYDEGWDAIDYCYLGKPYSRGECYDWLCCAHDNPHHPGSIKDHTMRVVGALPQKDLGDIGYGKHLATDLAWAGLLHDVGKKYVKSFQDGNGNLSDVAHYYHHENVGAYWAIGYADIMRLSPNRKAFITWLVGVHMEPFAKTKYYNHLSDELKYAADILHKADVDGA